MQNCKGVSSLLFAVACKKSHCLSFPYQRNSVNISVNNRKIIIIRMPHNNNKLPIDNEEVKHAYDTAT